MKRNIVLLICVCLLPLSGHAQINLVLNPSFEQYRQCPDQYDEAKYAYWTGLDTNWSPPDWAHAIFGVPDYCRVCAPLSSSVSIPAGGYYYHHARSGSAMMQVQMFFDEGYVSGGPQNFRDYLQGRLTTTLIGGKKYDVCFYVSSELGSYYSVNHIGAYFDNGIIDTTPNPGCVQSQYSPQILENAIINDTAIADTSTWIKVGGSFTAIGNEKFISIGQFTDRAHTNFFAIKDTSGSVSSGSGFSSLYLIDDVSVIDCDNIPFAGHDTVVHPGDSAFLGTREGLLPYMWYKLGDTTPITDVTGTSGVIVRPTVTTSYVLKQELCNEVRWDTVKVWVWPDTLSTVNVTSPQPPPREGEVLLWPNPTHGQLTITGAKGYSVGVHDLVGRCVVPAVIATEREVLQIGELVSGVYFVRFVDRATGEVVVREVVKE